MHDEGATNAYISPDFKSTFAVGEVIAGNYKIVGMAGSGGMGVVYRAQDLRLQRIVALKFLPIEVNSNEVDKQRFLKEARIASSLDHVNIGAIHGIDETPDGRVFIVMAFYEGQTLADRIHRGKPLSRSEAIDIAAQMARGLAEAHKNKIIHRDVKPSNVILTHNGIAKIVDFGLAHASEQSATLTHGGAGTVGYMSPEQGLSKSCDQTTDIWAWGIVFAEMLTGNNPFRRESVPATVVAILHEPPRGLDGLPAELQQIIYLALSKDSRTRYQNCSEVLRDLELAGVSMADTDTLELAELKKSRSSANIRRFRDEASKSALGPQYVKGTRWRVWAAAAAILVLALAALLLVRPVRERLLSILFPPSTKHVAVLPFDNIGNNPENQLLVQGLMDSLSGKLSNLDLGNQSLWVIPASEIRRRNVTDPAAALRDLGATLVVKGSVQRDGKDVRLNMSLIDTKNMREVGSIEADDPAGDLAVVQNDAVARLARLMNIKVSSQMLRDTSGSVNPAAYEDYLTGLGYMQRYDKPGNLDQAIAVLQNAVKTDPGFALGYAQLGEAYRLKSRLEKNPKWIAEAQAACQRAAELDGRLPAVYVTLGRLHDSSGNHDLAMQEFQRALDINPRDAQAVEGMGKIYEGSGRIAEAEAAYKRAAALRPESWDGFDELGNFYDRQSRYAEAIQQYQHALTLTPDNAQVYGNLGATYINAGDPKQRGNAEQALKKSIEISPNYAAFGNLSNLYLVERRFAEAAAATEKALELDANDYNVWANVVQAYDWLGEREKAEAARKKMLLMVEQAIKLKSQDAAAQSVAATLYADEQNREKALEHIQTALALAPDDPGVLSDAAETYELLGDRRRAIDYIQKALQKGYALDQIKATFAFQGLIADPNFKAGK